MPIAVFTPAVRERFVITEVFPFAELLASKDGEDQYAVGDCRVTYRYQVQPGDFVSRQVLGCHNAIRTGTLECVDMDAALRLVSASNAVIGIVGPDASVDDVAAALASRFTGVMISSKDAWVFG